MPPNSDGWPSNVSSPIAQRSHFVQFSIFSAKHKESLSWGTRKKSLRYSQQKKKIIDKVNKLIITDEMLLNIKFMSHKFSKIIFINLSLIKEKIRQNE